MMPQESVKAARTVGVVVIGRNEGERLRRCLDSLTGRGHVIVYVDSGSTDGSRALARSKNVDVVELDLSIPFTAPRARNAGFERLLEISPDLELVQFVDGDCEVVSTWIDRAIGAIGARVDVAAVCGRRRERHPEASIYNRLCDLEWNTPIGETEACGGDALMRAKAFRDVGGFAAQMIAGEESELCARLRRKGFKILRLDAEMTIHDAAMTRFGQWWNRALRTGHAAADRLSLQGAHESPTHLRRIASSIVWAIALPLITFGIACTALRLGAPAVARATLLVSATAYCALFARIYHGQRKTRATRADSALYAVACVLGKWPECFGALHYLRNRWHGRQARWIEYKDAPPAVTPTGACVELVNAERDP